MRKKYRAKGRQSIKKGKYREENDNYEKKKKKKNTTQKSLKENYGDKETI